MTTESRKDVVGLKISHRKIIAAAAVAVVTALCIMMFMLCRCRTYATVQFHMDTFISYYVESSFPEKAVDAMDREVRRCEQLFDRFSPESEITLINANAGNYTEVSEETYRLIAEAVKLAEENGGYFDPTLGAVSDLWGFGTDPRVPSEAEIGSAMEHVGYDRIGFMEKEGSFFVRAGEGQSIDLGGIAKGYALRLIGEAAAEAGCRSAVISFGGNVVLTGRGPDGRDVFSVGIRVPEENATSAAVVLNLGGGVVSTSGSYERFFVENGVRYCHIIDPFTGSCAAGDLVSVSVICDDPVEADCLSTALFVRGLDGTLDALASGEVTGVAIDGSGAVYISPDLTEAVDYDSVAQGYRLEVVG